MSNTNAQQTFENLVHAYTPELYRFAYWHCKNKDLAEDMLQECFARAWKALHKLKDDKAARAWLYTILRREIARHFSRKSSQELSLDTLKTKNTDTYDLSATDNLALLNNNDLAMHYDCNLSDELNLRQAIDKIPADYRDALLLQVLGGYSCDEIADISKTKPGTIMTRLFRARQKLRQLLSPESHSMKNSKQ